MPLRRRDSLNAVGRFGWRFAGGVFLPHTTALARPRVSAAWTSKRHAVGGVDAISIPGPGPRRPALAGWILGKKGKDAFLRSLTTRYSFASRVSDEHGSQRNPKL